VGKLNPAVLVAMSKSIELFLQSLVEGMLDVMSPHEKISLQTATSAQTTTTADNTSTTANNSPGRKTYIPGFVSPQGAKRMQKDMLNAGHLKQAIDKDERFDFLKDLVQAVDVQARAADMETQQKPKRKRATGEASGEKKMRSSAPESVPESPMPLSAAIPPVPVVLPPAPQLHVEEDDDYDA